MVGIVVGVGIYPALFGENASKSPQGTVQQPVAPPEEIRPPLPKQPSLEPIPKPIPPAAPPQLPKIEPVPVPLPPLQPEQPIRAPAMESREAMMKAFVQRHFAKFQAANFSALVNDYLSDASIRVSGFGAFAGNYRGIREIDINYRVLLSTSYFKPNRTEISNYGAEITENNATISLVLDWQGSGKVYGKFSIKVNITQNLVYSGTNWFIWQERWNATYFMVEVPSG